MEPFITETSTLGENDYLAFYSNATAAARRRSLIINSVLLVFCVCVIFLIFNHTGEISELCVIVFIFFSLLLITQLRWKGKAREMYNTYSMMQDTEITFNFFDDHLISSTEYDTCNIPYYKLYKIEMTPTHIFFYTGIGSALILRTDNQELRQFLTGLKTKSCL